jgi:excisionase family DNA binding protein
MALDLLSELVEQLRAEPGRAAELAPLLAPYLSHEPESAGARLLSVRDAAAIAGVSEKTIRRAINDGDLAAQRVGARIIRLHTQALAQWVGSQPARRVTAAPRRRTPGRQTPEAVGGVVAGAFRALDN